RSRCLFLSLACGPCLGARDALTSTASADAVGVLGGVGVALWAVGLAGVVVGAVAHAVVGVLRRGSPGEVLEPVVGLGAVEVPHVQVGVVLSEGGQHKSVDAKVPALALGSGGNERV